MSLLDAMTCEYGREVFGDGNVMPESVARVVTNGLRAALAEARKQGFVLVPALPNTAMIYAGMMEVKEQFEGKYEDARDVIDESSIYMSMISASPSEV